MAPVRDPQIEHARRAIRAALFGPSEGGSPKGATIGRFELLDKLGEGGMGVVYSARDPSLDRKVAIKLLRPAQAEAHGGRERLQREAHALAKLSHPNVVVVHEVGLHEGQVYLVMEFVDGVSLLQWCREHAPDWRAVVAKFAEAGRGLAVAHEAGFVHRDFKPDNVLVGLDERVRVLDFGLAATGTVDDAMFDSVESSEASSEDLTLTGTVLGTPAYMAPEQHDAREVDARADQFAFCVALWEALFGERPFPGRDLDSLRASLVEGVRRPAPAGSEVPTRLVHELERGLSIDPQARFADMPSLLEAIRAASAPQAPPNRRAGAWAAASLIAAVVVAAIAWSDDPAVPADDAPVTHEESPAPPSEDSSPRPVSFRQLTHTGGRGPDTVDIDHQSNRMLYYDEELRVRSIDGGIPRPVELPLEQYDHVMLRADGGYLVSDAGRLIEVDANGAVRELVAYEHGGVDRWLPWNGGRWLRAIASSTLVTWDLETGGPPARVVLPMSKLQSVASAPDGRAIAATMFGRDQPAKLVVFDEAGQTVASTELPGLFSSVEWLPNGALVALEDDGNEFWLRCYRFEDKTLVPGPRSTTLGPYSRFNRIVEADQSERLLLHLTEAHNDVAVIDPEDPAKTRWLSDGWDGNEYGPVWRADGTLAVATGRFLTRTLVSVAEDYESVTSIVEEPIAWVEGDGKGGLVYATSQQPTALRWIAAETDESVSLALGALPADPTAIRLDCIAPDNCLVTIRADETTRFFALDLTQATLERAFGCPYGWSCDWGRRRWSYARDGKRVLIVHADQRRLGEFDARTGDLIRTFGEPPPGTIIQSVRETADGTGYWLTGMDHRDKTEADGLYVLYRYDPDSGYRVVWHHASHWVFGPEPSRDDALIAVDALTLHSEAWLAEIGDLCGP